MSQSNTIVDPATILRMHAEQVGDLRGGYCLSCGAMTAEGTFEVVLSCGLVVGRCTAAVCGECGAETFGAPV